MDTYGLGLLSRNEYATWLKSLAPGACPFCEWWRYQIVLHEGAHWLWIACRAPYWRFHTMLVPKRHFKELAEVAVVEIGELLGMYSSAMQKLKSISPTVSGEPIDRYLMFWRLRESAWESKTETRRMEHFHMHLVPDLPGRFDPILDPDAHTWDPSQLKIARST